jgi:uncharacterized protein YpuA (DUF1002 family)
MKREPKIFMLTIISLIMLCAAYQAPAQENTGESDKVAVVNGTIISQEQFDTYLNQILESVTSQGKSLSGKELTTVKEAVLERLIKDELLYQECQKSNIEITDTEVNKKLEAEKSQFASDADFQQLLTKMKTNEELYKTTIKKKLALQRLINQKFKPTITDEEVKAYYDANPDKFKEASFDDTTKASIRKTLGTEKIADSYAKFYTEVKDNANVDIFLK